MRRTLVAALAAAVVGIPAVPAYATIDHCPAGVSEVEGTQPTYAQVDTWLKAAAEEHDVPVAILRVIAYKESTWRQFASNGGPLVSGDATCGLGLMQVTADDRADAVQLAEDGAYNAMEGAEILRAKWDLSQTTPPPTGYAADDPDVIENWYYAICLYNGCDGSSDLYAADAAKHLNDPFLSLPLSLREFVKPAGFVRPSEVKPSYVFPTAFQAWWTASGGEFVFYDHTTGVVSDVIPARVHRVSAPPVVAYPKYARGPDGPDVTCGACAWWRLAEGTGLSGRTRWTNSVTDETVAQIDWNDFDTGAGRYRVDAFIPSLGTEMLGRARYWFGDGATWSTAVVDQNARKGWVTLTERVFDGPPHVAIVDASDVAGMKLVADAVRVVPVPTLTLTRVTPQTQSYGNYVRLYLTLTYANGDGVRYRYVTLHRRALGTTAWQRVATLRTSDMGAAGTVLTAERNVEYMARFTPAPGDYIAGTTSAVVRQYVAPRVAVAVSDTTPLAGQAVTIRTSVSPTHAGHAVQFQRWVSGTGWRTVAYARLDASSRAAWTFTASGGACGTTSAQRYRVYKPADHDHVAGASAPVDLRVAGRC